MLHSAGRRVTALLTGSHAYSTSSSSKNWLTRQGNDPFVKLKARENYRSRSAFKLLQIDERHDVFDRRHKHKSLVVVDLGAAPGGWCQVARQKLSTQSTVIAMDLLPMDPIPGVNIVQHDFLAPSASPLIRSLVANEDGLVDVILSDMAANMSGSRIHDTEASLQISEAVFAFAQSYLRRGNGTLLIKHFAHPELDRFKTDHLLPTFNTVRVIKPEASRNASTEAHPHYYMASLCPGYQQIEKFEDDNDMYSSEEEVVYVTMDLGAVEPTLLPSSSEYRMIGLDTSTPYLQLSGTILRGKHERLLGSELLFHEKQDESDRNRRTVQPVGISEQRIRFHEVKLTRRTETETPDISGPIKKGKIREGENTLDHVVGLIAPAPRKAGRKKKAQPTSPSPPPEDENM